MSPEQAQKHGDDVERRGARRALIGAGLACLLAGMAGAYGWSQRRPDVIEIDPASRHQVIEGLGGFGAREGWWKEPPYYDTRYLDLVVDELGMSMVRTQLYWDFEPENDDADPEHIAWTGFDGSPETLNGRQLPFLRALRDRGVTRLIASVWSPPVWMKLSPNDDLARFCKGQCGGRLDPDKRKEYAEYLVAYVQWLERETGLSLYALSLQNEPLFENAFESCVYDAADYAATLRVVGARFEQAGLKTRLFGPEHMGAYYRNERPGLFDAIVDDPETRRYLTAYAVHGYSDGVTADYGEAEGWTAMYERVHAAGLQLWMTETSDNGTEGYDKALSAARGLHLALRHGNVSAWVHWFFGGHALDDAGRPTPMFYALQQYMRHVRPGMVRVGSEAPDARLLVTAFEGDEAPLTVVVINNGRDAVTTGLRVLAGATPGFDAFRTSETAQHVALGEVDPDTLTFPPRSITTLVARPATRAASAH